MNKKIIIILTIVVVALIIGLIIFSTLTSKKEPPTEEVILTEEERVNLQLTQEEREQGLTLEEKEARLQQEKQNKIEKGGELEEVRALQIKKIIDRKVEFSVFSADKQSLLYYDEKAGEFYRSNLNGLGENVMTNARFEDLNDVSWSPDRKKTVLTFSSNKGKTKKYHFFNLEEQKDIEYGDEYQSATISFDGDQVAYIYRDTKDDEYNLSVANADLTSWRQIKDLNDDEIKLEWFSDSYLAIYDETSAYEEGELYVYDVGEGKNHFVMVSDRWGLAPIFSPDGKKVVFNDNGAKNARYPSIWVQDVVRGAEPKKLQLSTLVEKCAWASDNVTIFCGVPENYSNFFIQPDDYYKGKFVSKDSFYKINTETKEKEKLADASQFKKDYDVYRPFVSDDGKDVYFTRKHDGKLYVLIIP